MDKNKSKVTEHSEICVFCGRPAECEHHLIFGIAHKEKADEDGLVVPACNNCHNLGKLIERVHENPMAEKLSKMLGQAIWERNWILKDTIHDKAGDKEAQDLESRLARKEFRRRYGRSYL